MAEEKEWMILSVAAKYIGVSPTTMRRLADNNEVPYYKIGKARKFLKHELDEYLTRVKGNK
jgi:excisionase family DNA binding protein